MSIFKKLIASRRQEHHEQAIESIMTFLLQKAGNISERAVRFVKKLKNKQQIQASRLFGWTYKVENPNISPICSKIMSENYNYAAFRCYDCMESVSSCICAECFSNGDHKGHNYVQYQAINGCCDCGNQESWNQKGFCKNHGKMNEFKFNIQASIQKLYLQELGLAFWIYFYLSNHKNADLYKQQYGNALFDFLIILSKQNYEMKYLAFTLLSHPLPEEYKMHDIDIQSTILHRIFKLQPSNELNRFVQLTFQIFPVQEFRTLILQEYFEKIKKKGEVFANEHPLAMLNFQFLSCVKLINKLIETDVLKPFLLYPYKFRGFSIDIPAAFKKYFEDLDYINNMKSSKEYYILHLKMSNVCELCFYRQFTSRKEFLSKRLESEQINEFNLDELFLKTFGQFVKNIKEEKQLIQKCLKQLIQFISEADVNYISLAHERAFCMLVYAYFDGNIYELLQEETSKKFANIIFNDEPNIIPIFRHFLRNVFSSKLQMGKYSEIQVEYNQHEKYFLRMHPQKNFCQFLDVSFQKIMLMICKPHIDYSLIVGEAIERIKQMIEESEEIFEYENEQEDEQTKAETLIALYSNFYNFLNFINSVTRVKIDQIVISSYIGVAKDENITHFYQRLLSTFKNLNSKQFKNLAISIINNEETLEMFIKQHCIIQKGKIRNIDDEVEPLETCIYHEFFKKYDNKIKQVEPCFLKKTVKLLQFQNYTVINSETASNIMEIIMNFLFKFTSLTNSKNFSQLFSLICFEYFKLYLQNHSPKEKTFFQTLLQPSFRTLITNELLEQITLIEKESEELQVERGRIKDQKQLIDKKKRQKLLAKRRDKQLNMKKAQMKILKTYQSNIKTAQNQECLTECIYCRSPKKQQLNFISYIGLTNFYEQNLMKEDDYHVYVETCGHKIHRNCYEIVMMKSKSNYCFLCKRETNILIPQYSQRKQGLTADQAIDIMITFQVAVINQRQDIKPQIKDKDQFLSQPEANFYQLLIKGICKDIFYLALQDHQKYTKNKYQIHYQLYLLLRTINRIQICEIFKSITIQNSNKYSQIQNYIQLKLQQAILDSPLQIDSFQINQIQQQIIIIDCFFKAFVDKNSSIEIDNLNLFQNKSLFISLPENLGKMSLYLGQCKLCKHVTNYIYICLKCGWNSCRQCLINMHKHSTYSHIDGTIFISCTNGAVKYLHAGTIFEDDSLYENYLGESYMEINSFSETIKIEKFTLNTEKLQRLQNIALQYGIHQKIFLNDH